jgi:hypothetical protein
MLSQRSLNKGELMPNPGAVMKMLCLRSAIVLFCIIMSGYVSPALSQAPRGDAHQSSESKRDQKEKGVNVVTTSPLSSVLVAGDNKIRVSGRISFHLVLADQNEGMAEVKGFNLVYFDVPQQMLAGKMETKNRTGSVGFAADLSKKPQILKYDAKEGRLRGEIKGQLDAAYMSAMIINEPSHDDKKDSFRTVTQPATVSVDLHMVSPLEKRSEDVKYDVYQTEADVVLSLRAEAIQIEKTSLPSFEIRPDILNRVKIEVGPMFAWEVARELCVRPVRVGSFKFTQPRFAIKLTGSGLAFGQPGAATQWNKADTIFNYRTWRTIWKSGFLIVSTNADFTTSTEQADLLDEVDEADCIEVYFIDEYDPVEWGGGGAAWGRGTANAKIITSDAVADGGVDFTHLAHELGHVMGLTHPAGGVSSSNTLMCPSGWLNDNPTRNSQENENLLSNPLFTFAIKVRSPGPDCQSSADCGTCPPSQ